MSLTPDQIAMRKQGITATDIAAIVGVHPFRAPIDVWRDKMGIGVPFDGNARTEWGNKLEPLIRADYEQRHDVHVEVHGTMVHPDYPWWMFTPDGLVFRRAAALADRGLEIKVHNRDAVTYGRLEYGAPGTDEVPQHELIQCQWSMGGSKLDRWDLVMFDGAPNEYAIERDDELLGMLQDEAEKFLVDYVYKKEPPPPDGSKAYDDFLGRHEHKNENLLAIDALPETMALVRQLRLSCDDMHHTKAQIDIIIQNLKAMIGPRAGLGWTELEEGKPKQRKITWRQAAGSTDVDYHAAWRSNVTDAQLVLSTFEEKDTYDEAVNMLITTLKNIADENRTLSTYTSTAAGSRRFLMPKYWSKNREGV